MVDRIEKDLSATTVRCYIEIRVDII